MATSNTEDGVLALLEGSFIRDIKVPKFSC